MLQSTLWFFIVLLYSPILIQLYRTRWDIVDYSHAYFILPASLLIVWLKRKKLAEIFIDSRSSGSPLHGFTVASFSALLLGLLLFIFGWRQNYLSVSTFSLIPLLIGTTGYLYGRAVLKELRFPILYLFFMIPPPLGILDAVTLPLRYGTSIVTAFLLQLIKIPVHREGLLLFLAEHEIYMAETCSGFRSLITFLSLSFLYVYFKKTRTTKKIILLLSAGPLALLGNLIRVMFLCLVSYFLGDKIAQGFVHELSGIVVFMVVIFGFMAIERCLSPDSEQLE